MGPNYMILVFIVIDQNHLVPDLERVGLQENNFVINGINL